MKELKKKKKKIKIEIIYELLMYSLYLTLIFYSNNNFFIIRNILIFFISYNT